MITCTKKLHFAAGHRVYGHESKCAQPHGHNYRVEITARMVEGGLDTIGRVIDFGVLKERVGSWIDKHWDHGFLVYSGDVEMYNGLRCVPDAKVFPMRENPTAETIAAYLLHFVCPEVLKETGVEVIRVVVHETDSCFAEAVA
jgi:6-pyruvoyltetrahydropterin/6-carboxytetrahydropterin synthase